MELEPRLALEDAREDLLHEVEHSLDVRRVAISAEEGDALALTQIGRITGRVDLDELLDVVFRDFCVGK